jgi:hypothetical protein
MCVRAATHDVIVTEETDDNDALPSISASLKPENCSHEAIRMNTIS